MSTTELVKLSAAEMAAKIKAKEVSSRELVELHLAVSLPSINSHCSTCVAQVIRGMMI